MMPKEIERKFLVRSDAWQQQASSSQRLVQGYVAIGDDRNVRIRLLDARLARLTIKLGRNLASRDEYEYDIPVRDAQEMIRSSIGTVIEKVRHIVDYKGFTWEVDVFEGAYRGLVVAEVELASQQDDPPLPDWIGMEVTGDRRYSNMVMATEDRSGELAHGLPHPA